MILGKNNAFFWCGNMSMRVVDKFIFGEIQLKNFLQRN